MIKSLLKIVFTGLLFSLVLISCKKEEGCMDLTALNYDADAEKACESCCEPEPEPEVIVPADPRDDYIGSYWVTQDMTMTGLGGTPATSNYTLVVSKDPAVTGSVILANMFNQGNDYSAALSGANFSFTETVFPGSTASGSFGTNSISYNGTSDIWTFSGSGTK
jgi:hypothetical protein